MDYEEVRLYKAINTEIKVLQRSGIVEVCPTKKYKCGRKPTITAIGTEEKKVKWFKPWNPPRKQADKHTLKG